MAGYVNLTLIGNVGQDPKIRTVEVNGESRSVLNFNVCVTLVVGKKQDGEKIEDQQWYGCTIWGKQAETFEKYVKKGHQVFMISERNPKIETYENKDGEMVSNLKIDISKFVFLNNKTGEQKEVSTGGSGGASASTGSGEDIDPDELFG